MLNKNLGSIINRFRNR